MHTCARGDTVTCCHTCRITLELHDRQTKVDVLHSKFEMLASRAHGTDADGGEPKSQAYYIVKVGPLVVVQVAAGGLHVVYTDVGTTTVGLPYLSTRSC